MKSIKEGKMSEPLVSLIIPNLNGKEHLKTCLSSIQKATYKNVEIIVVDNASKDGSVEFIRTNYPKIKLIAKAVNLGFAKGCNEGMRNAKGKYIALLNNDTEVDSKWLEELVQVAESNPRIGVCASKIVMFHDRKILNSAGGEFDIYGFGHDRGLYETDKGQYSRLEEVFFACGGAMLIRKEILNNVGFFDSRYFMYGEDLDFCWRARLQGYRVIYVPSAVVYHKYGGTMEAADVQRLYLNSRNNLCSILKNYGSKSLVKAVLRFSSLKAGETLFFLIAMRINASSALLKAFVWNIRKFASTWKKRENVQMSRKVPDLEIERLLARKSIELRWFMQGYFPKFNRVGY